MSWALLSLVLPSDQAFGYPPWLRCAAEDGESPEVPTRSSTVLDMWVLVETCDTSNVNGITYGQHWRVGM